MMSPECCLGTIIRFNWSKDVDIKITTVYLIFMTIEGDVLYKYIALNKKPSLVCKMCRSVSERNEGRVDRGERGLWSIQGE